MRWSSWAGSLIGIALACALMSGCGGSSGEPAADALAGNWMVGRECDAAADDLPELRREFSGADVEIDTVGFDAVLSGLVNAPERYRFVEVAPQLIADAAYDDPRPETQVVRTTDLRLLEAIGATEESLRLSGAAVRRIRAAPDDASVLLELLPTGVATAVLVHPDESVEWLEGCSVPSMTAGLEHISSALPGRVAGMSDAALLRAIVGLDVVEGIDAAAALDALRSDAVEVGPAGSSSEDF